MHKQIIIENLRSLTRVCPIEKIQVFNEDLIIIVKPKIILDILLFFKHHVLYQFNVLTCISGVDFPPITKGNVLRFLSRLWVDIFQKVQYGVLSGLEVLS